MPQVWVPSAAWRVVFEDGLLLLHAGADVRYALEDVDEATALEVVAGWERGALDPAGMSPLAAEVVRELAGAGAVRRGDQAAPARVALRWVGDVDPDLERRLLDGMAESGSLEPADDEGAGLLLVVRTNERLVDLYGSAGVPAAPHLLLDVAYHHTVSLGPLVYAGETACLACLAGRLASGWGDPLPPERPAALAGAGAALAAALAVRELEAVAAGEVRLANATAAYDLDSHRVLLGALYKLPWCPDCGDRAAPDGPIALPWFAAA